MLNPVALKAKIVYNFGLFECNRVEGDFGSKKSSLTDRLFPVVSCRKSFTIEKIGKCKFKTKKILQKSLK